METLILLLILIILYIIIVPLIALSRSNYAKSRTQYLESDILTLRKRIATLEDQLKKEEPEEEKAPLSDADFLKEKLDSSKTVDEQEPEKEEEPRNKENILEEPVSVPLFQQTDTSSKTREEAPASESSPTQQQSLEETLSTKWSVWIGGIALALGAIFLVKYSIEQGWIGPGIRIIMATIFSFALLVAGEYLRRKDVLSDTTSYINSNIPGILTGVGVLSLYATIFAAYALYHFISPELTFILLAVCSVAAIFVSALHHPWITALGLAGSFATPLLVQTDTKSAAILFSYLGFVGIVSYMVAFLRKELWIAVCAMIGSAWWALAWITFFWSASDLYSLSIFVTVQLITAYLFLNRSEEEIEGNDWTVLTILGILSLLSVPVMVATGYTDYALAFVAAIILILLSISWQTRSLSYLNIWSAFVFLCAYVLWSETVTFSFAVDTPNDHLSFFLKIGATFAAAYLLFGYYGCKAKSYQPSWVIISTATPLLIVTFLYWKFTNLESSLLFGAIGLFVALLYVYATEAINRADGDRASLCSGIYATAAVSALALSLSMAMEKGWLTVSLALMTTGVSWVALIRPIAVLRHLTLPLAVVVIIRLLNDPTYLGNELGTTPIVNWLLYGYGVPAIAFFFTAQFLKKKEDDNLVALFEILSITFFTLLVSLQIHHFMNDGNLNKPISGLDELAVHTLAILLISFVIQITKNADQRPVFRFASYALGAVGLVLCTFGILLSYNPYFTGANLGPNLFLNILPVAYILPALLCFAIHYASKGTRDPLYGNSFGIIAGVMIWTYLTLQVRRVYQGPVLTGAFSKEELYTYSVVWLIFGLGLLGLGLWRKTPALRYASFALIMMTTCKAFLLDMSSLTGILRAFSFIGLGVALMAIGYFYQRYIFPKSRKDKTEPTDSSA